MSTNPSEGDMAAGKPLNLTLIVAATKNLGIGLNGTLPWRLRQEMQYFARVTTRLPAQYASASKKDVQNAVIMGRKTWESIPKKFRPLKDRVNVVLSRNAEDGVIPKMVDGAIWAKSLEDAVVMLEGLRAKAQEGEEKIPQVARAFVIGGAHVYRDALALPGSVADRVLLTKVHNDFECDTFFPVDLDGQEQGWQRKSNEALSEWVGEEIKAEKVTEGDVQYEYCVYEKAG